MADTSLPFRVHFEAGEPIDVTAINAEAARKIALERHGPGIITKVKIVRETGEARDGVRTDNV